MKLFLLTTGAVLCLITHLISPSQILAESPELQRLAELKAVVKKDKSEVVIDLSVDCTDMTDDDYRLIGQLTTLKSISISGKPMYDQHLKLLGGLSNLEAFQINGTQLTDDGYRHFAAFPKLKRLSLFHPSRDVKEFTGAGLAHLKSLPELRRLTFAGATAGDEAFQAVGTLTQLEEFSEWHNWESPDAIKHLSGLKLKKLKLGQRLPHRDADPTPSLTDETLADVAKLSTLESLDIQEARLSYGGLVQLKTLPKLKIINLKLVDISNSDIEKLRATMPNITINWEPLSEDEDESVLVKKLKL